MTHPTPDHRERGSATVMVGLLLTSLVAMGAFVFDWGSLLHERRQLQNGVDAAVLAVAEDCAYGECTDPLYESEAVAQGLLDPNAEDGVSALEGVDLDLVQQTVTVGGSTLDAEGRSFVRLMFGRLLSDDEGMTVQADATARWGGLAATNTVPLAMHECEWQNATNFGEDLPSPTVTIHFHNSGPASCAGGPANQNAPGNWGWLDKIAACNAATAAGEPSDGLVGNPLPENVNIECTPPDFPIGEPMVFPIFSDATGQGNNVQYHIVGYAAFVIEAYKLHSAPPWSHPTNHSCGASAANCMTGRFVALVVDGEPGGPGGPDLGARAIALIG